jgi:hypothetical protein
MRAVFLAPVLIAVLALGCGGGGQPREQPRVSDPQRALGQDSAAKSNVRNLVTAMETCYVDLQDYRACVDRVERSAGLPIGADPGQVQVTSATPTGYGVTAHSESGNEFTIRNRSGSLERVCTGSVEGGCDDGTW